MGAAIDYLSGIGMQKIHDYEVRISPILISCYIILQFMFIKINSKQSLILFLNSLYGT